MPKLVVIRAAFDDEAAKALIEEYRSEGDDPNFALTVTREPAELARAEIIREQLRRVGIDMKISSADRGALSSEAVSGRYQAMTYRGFAGPEPDTKYVAWQPGSPVNLARIDDPEIMAALDEGRIEPDPEKRRVIYERIAGEFAEDVWNIWLNYTPWAVAESQDVHGIHGTDLPDDGGPPFTGLAGGHPLHGMWVDAT